RFVKKFVYSGRGKGAGTRGGVAPFHQTLTSAIMQCPRGDRGWEYAPMKQSEARVRIIQEWDRWILTQAIEQDMPTGKDSLKFFHELQDTGSPLLDFQSRGQDKWRIIHAWLLGADRLFDDWISAAPRIAPSRRMRPERRRSDCKT